jgi:hypothetical protein
MFPCRTVLWVPAAGPSRLTAVVAGSAAARESWSPAYDCRVDAHATDERQRREWVEEFAAAARRPLRTRLRYAFIRTYKPVLDDAGYRSFDSLADYRSWCSRELPAWLGYGQAV